MIAAQTFDPRLTPARPDAAASHLRGVIDAPRYLDPQACLVAVPVAPLRPRPQGDAAPDSELLMGEGFVVYDREDGWAWGQSELDGYVGYIADAHVVPAGSAPSHRVSKMGSNVYPRPELKTCTTARLPFGARVSVRETQNGFVRIGDDQWLPAEHVVPITHIWPDWVSVAEMFLATPYLWGGRSCWGIDCSGLVQLSLQAAGRSCPRDSDMQASMASDTLDPASRLERGDLIFWRGHVGIMVDPDVILHANGHHMAVISEPLADAVTRIAGNEFGAVTRRARLPGPQSNP